MSQAAEKKSFSDIREFTLENKSGMKVRITNYGAIITSVLVPDRDGKLADVVLGYDRLGDYLNANDKPYFGAIVGRYGNRIAKGRFSRDGVEYKLATNNGENHLHGGYCGYDKRVWEVVSEGSEVNHARVLEAIEDIVRRAGGKNIAVGIFAVSVEQVERYVKTGVRFIAYGTDTLIVQRACRDLGKQLQQAARNR